MGWGLPPAAATAARAMLAFAAAASAAEPPDEPPLEWREWGAAAFQDAAKLPRPVLLLIEAPWAHAGSELRRRLDGDAQTCALVRRFFVPIRVDRDRRPDVDRRFQFAARTLGQPPGWPLAAVLTPEGEVLWCATPANLDDDYLRERPGARTILAELAAEWTQDAAACREKAKAFDAQLRAAPPKPPAAEAKPDAWPMVPAWRAALEAAAAGSDVRFPAPWALEYLRLHHARAGDEASGAAALRSLRALLDSGVHDRLGGGFHRAARGAHGEVPRFEKLLAVQVEMLAACLRAWQASGDEVFRQAGLGTGGYLLDVLACGPRGGFGAAQAASAPGTAEGAFFSWTCGEAEGALSMEQAAFARHWLDIRERGELIETRPEGNVLFEALSAEEAARRAGLDPARAPALQREVLTALRRARALRPAPPVERRAFVDANARAVAVLLEAGEAWEQTAWRTAALATLERLLREAVDPARGAAHEVAPDGAVVFLGLAADEAALARACLAAYAVTGEPRHLDAARDSLRRLDRRFRDEASGLYRDRAAAAGDAEALGLLSDPHEPCEDAPLPSVQALAALAHLEYAAISGDEESAQRARQTAEAGAARAIALGPSGAALRCAADAARNGLTVVTVSGGAHDERRLALLRAARANYAPHLWVIAAPAAQARFAPAGDGSPRARVWRQGRCEAECQNPEGLREAVKGVSRP